MFAEDLWEVAAMSSKAQQFAATVLAAFSEAGHHTDEEVGDAGGPSTTTMTKLRKVALGEMDMSPPRSDTLRKIDRAADWKGGSARKLWLDGTPPELNNRAEFRAALGGPPLTAEERRRRGPRPMGGFEGWVESLADRVLELEERVDILEADLKQALNSAPITETDLTKDEVELAARQSKKHPRKGVQEQPAD